MIRTLAAVLIVALTACNSYQDDRSDVVIGSSFDAVDATPKTQVTFWLRAFSLAGPEVSACELHLEIEGLAGPLYPATCYDPPLNWGGNGILGSAAFVTKLGGGIAKNPRWVRVVADSGQVVGVMEHTFILETAEVGTVEGATRGISVTYLEAPGGAPIE
jgi:hypothetical protein